MGRRSRLGRGLVLGLAMVLLSGRPLPTAAANSTASVLRIAVSGLPPNGFPIVTPTSALRFLRGFTGRSLTIYDKSWAVACMLCTELPTLENGGAQIVERADGDRGIDVTFELRPELTWDDGVPVTTADVMFGIEVAHALGDGAVLPNILDAVALDDHRFVLREAGVQFNYNRMEDVYILPAHRERAILAAASSPPEYRSRSLYSTDPSASGLAYGPYRIEQVGQGEIVLAKNEYWRGKDPNFDQITLRTYPDLASVAADLAAGKVDMVAGETGLDLDLVYSLEAGDNKSAYNFIFKPTLKYDHIDINLSNPLLADRRIRRAMLLSLKRPIIVNELDREIMGDAPRSFLPPTSPNFDPTLRVLPYDPAQAATLFDAAGFARGADGIRADSQGRRLAFHLLAPLDRTTIRQITENVRDQWHRAGVEITLESGVISKVVPLRKFDLAYYAWTNLPEFLLEPVYGKSGIPSAENNYRGLNFPGLDDDEMNKTVRELATEMAPARRLLLWRRAQQIYAEQLPALPLSFSPDVYILPATMTGVEPTGHMIPISFWVEDWTLH
jgi:peptide/nickel transport system substrate-binding protein